MKNMHNHANEQFDCLHSGHQSINPAREVISILWETQKIYVCSLCGGYYQKYVLLSDQSYSLLATDSTTVNMVH